MEASHVVLVVGVLLGEHFQGHASPQLELLRQVDLAHATSAEAVEDLQIADKETLSPASQQPLGLIRRQVTAGHQQSRKARSGPVRRTWILLEFPAPLGQSAAVDQPAGQCRIEQSIQ